MLFVLYLFPALVDLLAGSFFFVASVRVAQSGASAVVVGAVLTVWGFCYTLTSLLSGRLANRASYIPMLLAACAVMALASLAFILVPGIAAMFAIMAILGIAVGFFYPPYQVFMRDVATGVERGLHVSAAEYTFAWSLGLAAGPFIAGFLWKTVGWQWVFALDAFLALLTGAGTLLFARRGYHAAPAPRAAAEPSAGAPAGRPDMARVGWLAGGALILMLSAVRGLFPSAAVVERISEADQGIVLATICLGQAAVAFVLSRGGSWMYSTAPLAAAGVVGAAGLALFGLSQTTLAYTGAAFLFGLCSGYCLVYMIFHAMVHPVRAGSYIGINEAITGLAGIVGPLVGGAIAEGAGHSSAFLILAACYTAAVAAQTLFHIRTSARSADRAMPKR
jgi:MFS family permease